MRINPFLHRKCLKRGICGTGSENFKTGSKAHDPKPNFYGLENSIFDQKWPILTFKWIFDAKMIFTEPEVNFLDPETTSMASKTLLVYQEALFAKPEVTTF